VSCPLAPSLADSPAAPTPILALYLPETDAVREALAALLAGFEAPAVNPNRPEDPAADIRDALANIEPD
jgi:hypothetical protein